MTTHSDRLTAALAGRYRIERELGQGGMATVYLAEDLKHKRRVALKVLKPELAAVLGAERFVQEITTTAALQHPHILPLFDSGEADGFLFYVMPFIDGETLRSKLDRETQFGIDEAVRITIDVASALHYAHEQGVIHRDIKPENILLHDGRPMVADFGIALALSAAAGGRMTETGLSLGTPHYMSPEQATAAKEITARSDVYSLGSVLYEMLAGNPPHTGATAQAIIMKIIAESADAVVHHRKSVPPNVAAAVKRAIEKVPADRFATAKEFADALSNPAFTTATYVEGQGGLRAVGGRRTTISLGAVAGLSLLVAAWAIARPAADAPVSRFVVKLEDRRLPSYGGLNEGPRFALTPDGRELVYVADTGVGASPRRALAVRSLDQLVTRLLPGTENAGGPSVSWDGAEVAFGDYSSDGSIKVVSLNGGPPLTVADEAYSWPTWGPDGFVYFTSDSGLVRRVSGSGGPVEDVYRLPDPGAGVEYGEWLRILPGGDAALVSIRPTSRPEDALYAMRAVDLRTGRLGAPVPGIGGEYVAEARALVYVTRDGTVMAVPFDLKTLEPVGRPQALFDGVEVRFGPTELVIAGGAMAYAGEGLNAAEEMTWVRRNDGALEVVDPAFRNPELESFALDPAGARVAVTIVDLVADRLDVWVKQLPTGPLSRLTHEGQGAYAPAWIGDGRFISFVSRQNGRATLWKKRSDGVGVDEPVADIGRDVLEARWSQDGAWLVASVEGPPSRDIVAMRIGTDSVPKPLLSETYSEWKPSLSPDGRWLAYLSNQTGRAELFVRPFPLVQDGLWQVSTEGATDPLWSRDGRELFFRSPDAQRILVADMSRGPASVSRRDLVSATAGNAFEVNGPDRMFDVSPDGRRFLLVKQGAGDTSGDLVMVLNFTTELRAALKAGPR